MVFRVFIKRNSAKVDTKNSQKKNKQMYLLKQHDVKILQVLQMTFIEKIMSIVVTYKIHD